MNRKKNIANVWGENQKIVLEVIDDVFILPSVCERRDNIIEDKSKKEIRGRERIEERRETYLPVGCVRALTSTEQTSSARQEEGQSWISMCVLKRWEGKAESQYLIKSSAVLRCLCD